MNKYYLNRVFIKQIFIKYLFYFNLMEENNLCKIKNENELKDIALEYLKKDYKKNCDLISFLILPYIKYEFIYVSPKGVCFYIKNKDIHCISTDNKDISEQIVSLIDKCNNCACKTKWDYEAFNSKFKFRGVDECFQYIFKKDEKYKHEENILKLNESHIDFIIKNYSQSISEKELKELMSIFTFYGYYIDKDTLAGFVGRHADGEIGLLEVLPQYQRKGIGRKLMNEIVNEDSEYIPYTQVLITNNVSNIFHNKLGAEKYKDTVYWCYNEDF